MQLPPVVFRTKTYSVHWQGQLALTMVKTHYDAEAHLHLSSEEEADVERVWQELERGQKRVVDLPLYRLLAARERTGELWLNFGLTGYREYQGTNVRQPPWVLANPGEKLANPLALSAVAVTTDSKIILQLRSNSVGEYSGRWHVTPSGHIHPPQSLSEALQSELREELGIDAGEIDGGIVVTGLIVNNEISKPELTFLMRLKLSSQDVLSRSAPDKWEYTQLKPVAWEKTVVKKWLQDSEQAWVPPGHAALLLGGRADFGDDWMAQALASGIRQSYSAGI